MKKKFYNLIESYAVSWAKSRAFTLIELLIIVAIIMILMSMLLPALSKVKETTRRSNCTNNLKQIGVVFGLYAGDTDGFLPAGTYSYSRFISRPTEGITNLGHLLPDYLDRGGAQILYCPAYPRSSIYSYDDSDYSFQIRYPTSTCAIFYWYRARSFAGLSTDYPRDGLRMTDNPRTAVLADQFGKDEANHVRRTGNPASIQGLNTLYLDGHVDWVPVTYSRITAANSTGQMTGTASETMWNFLNE